MLEQYNKAIACLRPYFTRTDRDVESARVVLITCMIFVCLELLQGRYVEGQNHLQNGLNLLYQLQAELHTPKTRGVLVLGHPQESVSDSYLTEAFSRLYAQSSLFGQVPGVCRKPYAVSITILHSTIHAPPPLFSSMNQARQHLDELFNAIHCLTARHPRKRIVRDAPKALLDTQSHIQTCLRLWLQVYKVSRLNLISQLNLRDTLSYPLLTVYHTMAVVMATTCLTLPDESIYDSFEAAFASVVSTCEDIVRAVVQFIASASNSFIVLNLMFGKNCKAVAYLGAGKATFEYEMRSPATVPSEGTVHGFLTSQFRGLARFQRIYRTVHQGEIGALGSLGKRNRFQVTTSPTTYV
ncbi:uncharacterized protein CTRU02_208353 [Colletotrichum truncatum]|uniref:Uncharacterized protein n=1 Tax=Colletotrichum truncatum TaxID=5467 RepID=A0ACC3YW11_COLTU